MGSLLTAASHFYIPFTGFFLLLLLYYSVLCPPLLPVLFFLLPDAVFPVLLSFPLWLVLYLPVYCYLRNHPFFRTFSAVLFCVRCVVVLLFVDDCVFLSSVLPFDVLSSVPSVPVFLTGLSVSVKTTVSVCLQLLFLSVLPWLTYCDSPIPAVSFFRLLTVPQQR